MAALALAQVGDTPVEFGLRLMHDDEQPMNIRLHGARIAAPYVHPKPHPSGETVQLDLPDTNTAEGITRASAELFRAGLLDAIKQLPAKSLRASDELTGWPSISLAEFSESEPLRSASYMAMVNTLSQERMDYAASL